MTSHLQVHHLVIHPFAVAEFAQPVIVCDNVRYNKINLVFELSTEYL